MAKELQSNKQEADDLEVKQMEQAIKGEPKVVAQYTRLVPAHFTHDGEDFHLYEGESYTLPSCPFVTSLVSQGFLKLIS